MSPAWRGVIRGAVIAAGAAVTLASILAFRLADWPIYVAFVLVSIALFLPYVEVLPRLALPIPEMAATIGFLYIGGLPIIVLRNLAPLLARAVHGVLPTRWTNRVPQLRTGADTARRELFAANWNAGGAGTAGMAAEWGTFVLGLAVRWWIVSQLVPTASPATRAGAIAVAEVGGHACWGLLSVLPIYTQGPLLALSSEGRTRSALTDIGLIVVLALTPFVFLISYGYRVHGLAGATAWALSALGPHFMLKRLNDRRLTVEEQNRRLAALNRELEHRERLSAIGKMSSVVSHQILQQLGVIGIYADLIRNVDTADDASTALAHVRHNASAIEGAVHHVNRVLTDLLVFSKDLRLNLYEHPLDHVIDECLADCSAEAAARGITLRAECARGITVVLDKLKMKQAIGNVLHNAVDASRAGSEVTVRGAVRDGDVEIAVADHGPGIPEADREAVFTPFFTTKENGTGLGLAIAREFTEAHGGQLWAADNSGPGTTFVFRLPLRPR